MTFKTNLLPQADNTYHLGSSTTGWRIEKLNAPTASNNSAFGPGTNGQVLRSNGSKVYWGSTSDSDTWIPVSSTTAGYIPALSGDSTEYFSGGGTWEDLPVTSVGGKSGGAVTLDSLTIGNKTYNGATAVTIEIADLGLASTTTFLGITNTDLTNGSTTQSVNIVVGPTTGTVAASNGSVVMEQSSGEEYIWSGGQWNLMGLASSWALANHVHGNILNNGTITSDTAKASGQKLVITNSSNQVCRSNIALGTGTTTYLRNDGSWGTPPGTYSLPTASSSTKGGIKVGSGLTISNEVLSANVTGVKGNAEDTYRTGNVNLTAANIGAATSGHNHDTVYVKKAGDTMTGALHINYGSSDVGLNQNGSLIIGPKDGENLAFDTNEIMSRNNSSTSTLNINLEGGGVIIGTGGLEVRNTVSVTGGYVKITNNSNTVQIGSANNSYMHFSNSTDIPFYFNKQIHAVTGFKVYSNNSMFGAGYAELYGGTPFIDFHFGNSTADYTSRLIENKSGQLYIPGKLKVGTSTEAYALNCASFKCDSWVRSTGDTGWYNDTYGGGWYMSDTTWIRNYASKAVYLNNTLRVDALIQGGAGDNDTVERQVKAYSGSGQIYLYATGPTTGNRGIYTKNHAGTALALITVTSANQVTYADSYNGTGTKLAYSQSGMAASSTTWLACWNGYELRAISKAEMANATDSAHKWVRLAGDTMTGNLTVSNGAARVYAYNTSTTVNCSIRSESNGNHGLHSTGYYNGSAFTSSGAWIIYRNTSNSAVSSLKIWGAVWNDYAECRNVPDAQKENPTIKPGMCVKEVGDGTMIKTQDRLERGCKIVSDTFGFSLGSTKKCKTPIAVAGRVLVYLHEDNELAKKCIGYPVCSGPNGTVSIMTEEEEMKYPSRIIGTISEIPDYEIWHCGNEEEEELEVDGRIWIYVK